MGRRPLDPILNKVTRMASCEQAELSVADHQRCSCLVRQTAPVRLWVLLAATVMLAGCSGQSADVPAVVPVEVEIDWEPVCEDRVGLPIHSLDDFSDDFWGDVYKAEVRAARVEWLYFCGTVLPDWGVLVCSHLRDDANAPASRHHDEVMSAVADRSLHLCDAVFEALE